jgi:hypothetical protein
MFYVELKNETVNDIQKHVAVTTYIFIMSVAITLTPLTSIFNPPVKFTPRLLINNRIEKFIPYMKERDRVWVIWQNTSGLEFHVTRYLIAPRMVNGFNQSYRWSLGKPYYEGDIWTHDITPEDWRAIIDRDNYSYILVGGADGQFWDIFGEMFCGENSVTSNSQLFKVEANCFTAIKP